MQCKTIFSSKSWSNLKLDILKSGLQKYGRRRNFKKMVRCMLEMNLFKEFGKKGRGIRTNMINRMKVMCFEELCFCKPRDFLKIMRLIAKWEKGERQNDNYLIDICTIFVHSELLRLPSDIKNYYRNVYPKIHKSVSLALPGLVDKYAQEADNEKVLFHLSHFICDLCNKNDTAFYHAFMIINMAKQGVKGGLRWRRKDCDYIIWKVLFDKGGEELKECLHFALNEYFRKNRFLKGDRLVAIITAILWVMHKDELDWTASDIPILNKVERVKLMKWTTPFVPDAFIIDRHCAEGRAAGKNIVDFAKEGSLVVRENKKWLNERYRAAYIGGKVAFKKPRKKRTSVDALEVALPFITFTDLTNIEPCMERTCGRKAMCFFADYKGEKICLKEGRKSMNYNRDYIVVDGLKRLFGLNDLSMRRVKMDKVSKKKDEAIDTWRDNTEWVHAEGTIYSMMARVEGGVRLSWKKDNINMQELVKIGMYRGIFRVTDFNLTNVLTSETGELFSIDEHQIGMRKTIFGKKCGWKKDITREIVEIAVADLRDYSEVKWQKIREKLSAYKFGEAMIERCESNYKNLKKDVYEEMGWDSNPI